MTLFQDGIIFIKRLGLFMTLFFFWGFVTVMNFALGHHLEHIFQLDYAVGALINITFFSSYLVISSFAGAYIARQGYKKGIITGWVLLSVGCFFMYYAISERLYAFFLAAIFVQAAGITTLQVGANLYVVLMGSKARAAARLTMVQAFNSLGAFLAPFLVVYVMKQYANLPDEIRSTLSVAELIQIDAAYIQFLYLYLGIFMTGFALLMTLLKIPNIETQHIEPLNKLLSTRKTHVMHFRQLRLGAFAIFAYVGAEVSFAMYLETFSGSYGEYYWGAAMIGRFIGAMLLIRISPRDLVAWCAGIACALVLLSIASGGNFSVYCIVAIGLFNSILFPCIFALGVNGIGRYSLNGSSVLIMFIVGGAIIPFDVLNYSTVSYKAAFIIPLLCYLYILIYGKSLSHFEIKDELMEKEWAKD